MTERQMRLTKTIRAYHGIAGKHHRYRSWEHCYRYFQETGPGGLRQDPNQAALQLGFYLASWGMYRGSSFLLQFTYTAHLPFINVLARDRYRELWGIDVGSDSSDSNLIPLILGLMEEVKEAYRPFAVENGSHPPSETLVTKLLLGTLGCVPACDEFFVAGLRSQGVKYSAPNALFLTRMLELCIENRTQLIKEQEHILHSDGARYPLMKLLDMHFWQCGLELRSA